MTPSTFVKMLCNDFAELLTNESPLALFLAGTIAKDFSYHKSPIRRAQDFKPAQNLA